MPRPRTPRRIVLTGRLRFGASVAAHFRNLGWDVYDVAAADIHAVVAETAPHAVLMLEEAEGESGYLWRAPSSAKRSPM